MQRALTSSIGLTSEAPRPAARGRLVAWLLGLLCALTVLGFALPAWSAAAVPDAPESDPIAISITPSPGMAPLHRAQDGLVAVAGDCDARGWAEHLLAARPFRTYGMELSSLPATDAPFAAGGLSGSSDLPEPALDVHPVPLQAPAHADRVAAPPAPGLDSREPKPLLRPPRA